MNFQLTRENKKAMVLMLDGEMPLFDQIAYILPHRYASYSELQSNISFKINYHRWVEMGGLGTLFLLPPSLLASPRLLLFFSPSLSLPLLLLLLPWANSGFYPGRGLGAKKKQKESKKKGNREKKIIFKVGKRWTVW